MPMRDARRRRERSLPRMLMLWSLATATGLWAGAARAADAGAGAESTVAEEAEATGLDRCIECGLCSYVCPSKIELLSELRAGKRRVEEENAE